MKKQYHFLIGLILTSYVSFAQGLHTSTKLDRPKLVVGMVVDQMRWDYLYRYYDRYTDGGFKRLIKQGFSAENTFIPYVPTYTACGHSSIYTGSSPAINGIIGNDWYDVSLKRSVYCTEDSTVSTVGSNTTAGRMSPKNMLTTTITDELKLATNFRSKVIGISLKDRGSILPAGHTADAAYWYDGKTGDWITSSYYMKNLPSWLDKFNSLKLTDKYFNQKWTTLYPIDTYQQSTPDDNNYEGKFSGDKAPVFPHDLTSYIGKNYDMIKSLPFGNTLTLDLAKAAVQEEKLGNSEFTDFLAVSCSATDYVGHQYGPNSIEAEDTYLRLDKDLSAFLTFLDEKLGKGNYLFFLTADHGAAHVPGFMTANKLPGGLFNDSQLVKRINEKIKQNFNIDQAIEGSTNSELYFNHEAIGKSKASFQDIKAMTIQLLKSEPDIVDAIDLQQIENASLPKSLKEKVINGYNPQRSGDIYYALKSGYFSGGSTGTTHGSWYPYDTHIPCVFMGWNVKPGKSYNTHYMTDISATLAAMLSIQMPSGCIGEPITEMLNK